MGWITCVSVLSLLLSCISLFDLETDGGFFWTGWVAGYSFFDSYDVALLGRGRKRAAHYKVGEYLLSFVPCLLLPTPSRLLLGSGY